MRTFRETYFSEGADVPANRTGPGIATLDPLLGRALRWRARRRGRAHESD
jgi:hypothetical protein